MTFTTKEQIAYIFLAFIAPLFLLIGCGKSNDSGKKIATTPLSTECLANNNCNSNYYNQFSQYGFIAYPNTNPNSYYAGGYYGYGNYNYSYQLPSGTNPYLYGYAQSGFCNCPSGFIPTYNGQYGLGCVTAGAAMPYYNYAPIYWGLNASFQFNVVTSNTQWSSIPQISNYSGYSNYNSCNQVVQACMLNTSGNTCAVGQCRPTTAGSPIGICVQ